MGYVLEAVAYISGVFLVGGGLYVVLRGTFPAWWQERLLWPLIRITPTVSHLQGLAAIGLGISILAIVFSSAVPEATSGLLVLGSLLAYLIGLVLFIFSTWLSRRPAS